MQITDTFTLSDPDREMTCMVESDRLAIYVNGGLVFIEPLSLNLLSSMNSVEKDLGLYIEGKLKALLLLR